MKLSRLTNNQLRRLLREGEVRFASDEKESLLDAWRDLKGFAYEVGAVAMNFRRDFEKSLKGVNPEYAKKLNAAVQKFYKTSFDMEKSINQLKEKVGEDLRKMK